MKKFLARGLWVTLGLCMITTSVRASDFGSPSLLSPEYGSAHPIAQTAYGYRAPNDDLPSPSDNPAPPMMSGVEYGNGYDGGYSTYPAPPSSAAPSGGCSEFDSAMNANWGDGCDSGSCAGYGGTCGRARGGWFVYAGGLVMTRSQTGGMPLSYNEWTGYQTLNTNQVEQPWMGGAEIAFGKWFGCGNVGIEAVYWGLYPGAQTYDVSGDPTNGYMTSAIDFMGLSYNSRPYGDYWDSSFRQYLRRDNSFTNVEVNLIGNAWNFGGGCGGPYIAGYGGGNGCDSCCADSCGPSCGSNLTVGWLAGIRYFDFSDNLWYASSDGDYYMDGTVDEVFYVNNVKNQLVGFQMGGYMSYQLGCRWSIYGGAKAGVYNNHSQVYKRLYGTLGDATIDTGYYNGQAASARTTSNTLAALGQLDVGLRWQVTCNLALRAGYRVVGVSGVALADDQFLYNYADYGAYSDIDTNGSLLLHGAYAGGELCW